MSWFKYDKVNKTFEVVGISQPDAQVINIERHIRNDEKETILTVKVPGHDYYRGINLDRGYAPTEYQVYRIESQEEKGYTIQGKCTILTEFPARGQADIPKRSPWHQGGDDD